MRTNAVGYNCIPRLSVAQGRSWRYNFLPRMLRCHFLYYFPNFEKIKVGLWDDLAVCVSVCVCPSICVSPPNLWLCPHPNFVRRLLRSLWCLCVYVCPPHNLFVFYAVRVSSRRPMKLPCSLCLLYAVLVVSKEFRRLVFPRTSFSYKCCLYNILRP
jgi:hypothetical protein